MLPFLPHELMHNHRPRTPSPIGERRTRSFSATPPSSPSSASVASSVSSDISEEYILSDAESLSPSYIPIWERQPELLIPGVMDGLVDEHNAIRGPGAPQSTENVFSSRIPLEVRQAVLNHPDWTFDDVEAFFTPYSGIDDEAIDLSQFDPSTDPSWDLVDSYSIFVPATPIDTPTLSVIPRAHIAIVWFRSYYIGDTQVIILVSVNLHSRSFQMVILLGWDLFVDIIIIEGLIC